MQSANLLVISVLYIIRVYLTSVFMNADWFGKDNN